MAAVIPIPPNPFALKSNTNHKYLEECPVCECSLLFRRDTPHPLNLTAEIETISGYVHIKYVPSGKYLTREGKVDCEEADKPRKIVACACKQNNCTRFKFEPVVSNPGPVVPLFNPEPAGPGPIKFNPIRVRIVHVKSGLYLRPHGKHSILKAKSQFPDPAETDVFSITVGK